MQNKELKKYAKEIWNLELACQQGINISENLKKMEEIAKELSLDDLFRLDELMEESI